MITWQDFEKIDMRVGTVISAEPFPEARRPAYKLTVDFGSKLGIKKSSAQITMHYTPESLIGRQVIAVVNFPPKQIGPMMSECLVMGIYDEDKEVILIKPDKESPNGSKIG
ncbi:tRNA-binding protein [Marinoscillum furvescens]|uniref:tRNA-binding protein n=2 Tax=Marinoscillum furvescens TaxID=1026 RepID=A0A3D9L394_MARFU|nr:tRNA-binding protein [Marinoscillum furvescens DSM 4134]